MTDKNAGAAGTATKTTNKAGDLRKALADPTPLYFAAGVIDKIREVAPERLAAVKEKTADPKVVQERFAQQAKQTQSRLTSALSGLDTDLKKLREQAQHLAFQGLGLAAEYAVKARAGYGGLAERGRGAVRAWRGESAEGSTDETPGRAPGKAAGRAPLASRHRGEAVVVEAGEEEEKPRPKMGGTRQGSAGRTTARRSTADTGKTSGKSAAKPTPKTVAKKTTAKKTTARKTTTGESSSKSAGRSGGRSGSEKTES
ncbi:hypothetical protein [Streptomyces taklimakanensis]|uniref:hypothetical protein n=1 Tax=Streptomyces taklimakanensis TaxID=2569853 RepID=UPI00192E6D50|nr:hypothetical protein [Streptomyces taklimakanensis]